MSAEQRRRERVRAQRNREAIARMKPLPIEGVLWLHEDPGLLLTPEEDREAMAEDEPSPRP